MTTTIDHAVRENMNITSIQYIVADICAKYRPMLRPTGVKAVAEVSGFTTAQVSEAMKELISLGLLEKKENGYYYPTHKWYDAHVGELVEIENSVSSLTGEVISYFNEVNGTKNLPATSLPMIKSIIRQRPDITIQHFKSVILHKKMTWGDDEKMRDYNRPATLFSGKFFKYLDDATNYWIQKAKL